MKTEKVRFYTERNSFGVQAMIILMALSIAFRLIGCWGLWNLAVRTESTLAVFHPGDPGGGVFHYQIAEF